MSAPGVSELIAWIRSQIAQDRARAEKEAAATSLTDCLNAEHDPKDVLAAADTHEAMLEFIEMNFRSAIELDATSSGTEFLGDLFWTMKGSILLGYVAGAYRHRRGYAQAIACLTGTPTKVTVQLSAAADDELLQRRLKRQEDVKNKDR